VKQDGGSARQSPDPEGDQRSIYIRDTGLRITDVLELIGQGYSYYQILMAHPGLTLADIMLAAHVARELISTMVTSRGQLILEGSIEVTCHNGRMIDLTALRREYPRAFESWTRQEDEDLAGEHHRGMSINEIAALHGRRRGAIRTRLKKLGLLEPSGEG